MRFFRVSYPGDFRCPNCNQNYEVEDLDPYGSYEEGEFSCECGSVIKIIARKEWEFSAKRIVNGG